MSRLGRWYSTTWLGKVTALLYACTPLCLIYAQMAGAFPTWMQLPIAASCAAVGGGMLVCRAKGYQLFSTERRKAFTLIELMIVISVIGILSALLFPVFMNARQAAYFARAKAELRSVAQALEIYQQQNGGWPADVNRGLPPGLENYLSGNHWPAAPWPGSIYDWDNWGPDDLGHAPLTRTYQISVRFCPLNEPQNCRFPEEEWASGFDYYSSVYYCIAGTCRSHSSQPVNHPGKCVNCAEE